MNPDSINFSKAGGLVPAIVQDATTGKVLMQAYMNREALTLTLSTGKVTFFSRSKKRLWTKGETSGNYLLAREVIPDCDDDCLLVKVQALGPACHTGRESCFDQAKLAGAGGQASADSQKGGESTGLHPDMAFLLALEKVLQARKDAGTEKSYTARLLAGGPKKIAKKLGEEAVELALEAEHGTPQRFTEEAADLIYHLNVLLISRGMAWEDVVSELRQRHAV